MIIHSPIISGSLAFADGATFTLPDGGEFSGSFSGSLQVHNVQSSLIPNSSASYDLGSADFPFRDLYVSSGTGFFGGIGLSSTGTGLNIFNKSDNTPADLGANTVTFGGIGEVGSKTFGLNDNGDLGATNGDGTPADMVVGGLQISGSGGAVTMSVDESGTLSTTNADGTPTISALSGSFTGSVQDLVANGDATFNDAVTVSGLSSLDGGIDVDGAFTVADTSGNVSTTGTLDVTGLSSLDGGIDVDGAFTVADTSGNVATTGTLSAGATTVSGLTANGNISGSGTLSVGAATLTSTLDVTGLASLDGGIDVDGAFTVADSSGNVSTSGTLGVTGDTTLQNTDIQGTFQLGSVAVTSTAAELNILDGVTSTAAELNILDGVTADATEINVLDGITSSTAELNILTGVTADATEINKLDGVTSSTAELNILTGVTSTAAELNILDGVTADATEINVLDGITSSTAELNILTGVTVDATKLNYLTDMTGNVKNYIDTEVAGIVDSAPGTLDTLNELAAALGDDPNFATTISTTIGGKVSQSLQITAGDGLTGGGDLTQDRTLNVVGTLNRISVTADAVDIASTYVGQSSITTLGTISTGVWNGTAITNAYIGADAIDGTKIADDAVNSEHIADGAIDLAHMSANSVDSDQYVDGSIDRIHLAADIIDGTKIADDAVDSEHIANGAIDNVHLAGSIAASKITEISNLTADEGAQLENIGTTTISATQWGYLGAMNQGVTTSSAVTFASVSATGDIVAYASSDERLKDNIEVISNPIEKVQQLKGVTWNWNDNADELQKSLPNVGVIAQDVEKVLPQLVKDRENGYKGVDYDKIVGLLIEAIKDQQNQIDELKSKLS